MEIELTAVKREVPIAVEPKQITDYTKFVDYVGSLLKEKVIKATFEVRSKYDTFQSESYNVIYFWITSEAKGFFVNETHEYIDFKVLDVSTTANSDILTTKRIVSISESHLQIMLSESKI